MRDEAGGKKKPGFLTHAKAFNLYNRSNGGKVTGELGWGQSDKNIVLGTSLVAQRLRIRLPMQGTWV